MKKKLIAAACMLALGSTAFADEGEVKDRYGFYAYAGMHNLELDSSRLTNDRLGGNFGLGWAFNKNWQIEGQYAYTDDAFNRASGNRTDIITYSLDVLYNDTSWLGSATTHPFLKVGYGQHDDKYGVYHPDFEDEFYKVGLGIQHFANDDVFMRLGYDFMDSGERGDDKMLYFNVGLFFGDTVRSGAAPKVEPKKEARLRLHGFGRAWRR